MLYYQIPPTYVILPNSPNVCYITKFPQRMLCYQIPQTYVILPNPPNVCYITKFTQRMLYYQIPLAYVILQNLCPQQMLGAQANGETFVSATMCPRLPGSLHQT